ncbi:MAG: LPS export ABC transporter periplasmic protein LptC [Legionella sp.]
MSKQLLWLLCMITLLLGSGWYYIQSPKAVRPLNKALSSNIDTTIMQLTVRQFDAKGALVNVLQTPLLQHSPKDDINLLQTPRILISQEDQPAWEINALKAKSFAGGSRITFMQQVVVHQPAGDKTQASTFKTEEVTYFPKEKKAISELLVSYEQSGNFVQSTGMIAYLDEKRVELLHKARGIYDPTKA